MNTELSSARLPLMSNQPCLTIFEQFEMINKARLTLSLRSPYDDATLEEKNALYDEQKLKILNFVDLLHDSLITEHGKVLLCLYQCE